MLESQRAVRAQRAQIAKELKNAQRRRQRLKHKARLLTAADLASVLVLRQEEEEASRTRTKRRRSSQPGAAGANTGVDEHPTEEGSASELFPEGEDEELSATPRPSVTDSRPE